MIIAAQHLSEGGAHRTQDDLVGLHLGVILTDQSHVSQHIFFEQAGYFLQQISRVILDRSGEAEMTHLWLLLKALWIDPGLSVFHHCDQDLIEMCGSFDNNLKYTTTII